MRRETKDTIIGIALVVLAAFVLLIPAYFTVFRTHTFRWLLWRELQ